MVVALVEVSKRAGVSSRYAPLMSIFLGVLGVWAYTGQTEWLSGIVLGLSAAGLYSGVKTTVK